MKLQGKQPGAPTPSTAVFERGDDKFVFTIQAVLDFKDFLEVCPEPKPQTKTLPGGKKELEDTNTPAFQKKLDQHAELKTHWMVLKSLEATEGLEWETISMTDATTWSNYQEELMAAGFTEGEVAYVVSKVFKQHIVDEDVMQDALDRFTAGE